MKKPILLVSLFLFTFFTSHAQFSYGMFYHDFDNMVNPYSPCLLDSSLYTIRGGGLQQFTLGTDSVSYKWNRFYGATIIKKAFVSSMAVLKGGRVYQYFPASDSLVNISDSLPSATVTDIDASDSAIWAITNFDEIGRYDGSRWQRFSLAGSFNPTHILIRNDTSLYLADNVKMLMYSPSGLSRTLFTFTSGGPTEWLVDSSGDAWILSFNVLSKVGPTDSTTFGLNNPLASGSGFAHIAINGQNSVYGVTYNQLFRYRAGSWSGFYLPVSPQIVSMVGRSGSRDIYMQSADSLYILHDSLITYSTVGALQFMPYQNVSAISPDFIATDQGIFNYGTYTYPYMTPKDFRDTSDKPFANDVTCFVVNAANIDSGYGTHHGVYHTTVPINNANLPDTNITYLYYALGSYYIGTTNGLCIFNQVVYNTFDTSNSALPSNNITFIISYQSPYTSAQELWVGTDQGLALYTNGVWTRFDTSTIHTSSFYVTGILPCPYYYMDADSTVWVSTLGQGLVKVKRTGAYSIFNTAHQNFADDSLYYVIQNYGCEYLGSAIIGTSTHGIGSLDIGTGLFQYDTSGYNSGSGVAYTYNKSSRYATYGSYRGETLFELNNGFKYLGYCTGVGINETDAGTPLKWYQPNENQLQLRVPQDFAGSTTINMYDISGRRLLASTEPINTDGTLYLDISSLTTGVYILTIANASSSAQTKVVISK